MAKAKENSVVSGGPPKGHLVGSIARGCGLGLAILGVINFAIAIVVWLYVLWIAIRGDFGQANWRHFWFALPAPILFTIFLCALLCRKRRRLFWTLLCVGILVVCSWSVYDAVHDNYQIQMMTRSEGCKHTYFSWPWLNDGLDMRLQDLLRGPDRKPETRPAEPNEY